MFARAWRALIAGAQRPLFASAQHALITSTRRVLFVGASALFILLVPPCVSAGASSAVSPLPATDYAVRHVCTAPTPGDAGCLALELVPQTAAARAHTHPLGITRSAPIRAASPKEGAFGLRPQDLHSIYQLPTTASSAQTVAIVDAYDDSTAEHDLGVYDQEFGLPGCTAVNGCFKQVNQRGEAGNLPVAISNLEKTEADGWAGETSLDIEIAHAVCQSCKIVLLQTNSASFSDLEEAEKTAAGLGATEISNSWGAPEQGETPAADDASAFNQPGIVITAAAGDDGYLDWDTQESSERGFADYPASSPHVVAVGGTRLSLGTGDKWVGETVWNGDGAGGGGCSVELTAEPWQQNTSDWSSVGCGTHRAVADVSADADPYTGVATYDSTPEGPGEGAPGWIPVGGTSLASPLVASVFALAGGAGVVKYPAKTLYENEIKLPGSLHDVASGSNGECSKPFEQGTGISGCTELQEAADCSVKPAICRAVAGYDGPSGVGTPDGIAAFQPSVPAKEETPSESKHGKEGEPEGTPKSGGGGSGGEGGGGQGSVGTSSPPISVPIGVAPPNSKPPTEPLATPNSSAIIPILSAPMLTKTATAALSHGTPRASQVTFAFTLNVAARVHVTLAKQVTKHGHRHWQTLPYSLTIAGVAGRDSAHLSAHGALTPGRYRLTLTPAQGTVRMLTFQIV